MSGGSLCYTLDNKGESLGLVLMRTGKYDVAENYFSAQVYMVCRGKIRFGNIRLPCNSKYSYVAVDEH